MDFGVLATCLLIIIARIGDVSLGTMRTIMVVQGRRWISWGLGFFEVLIWLYAVSSVMRNLEHPIYALCYAFGFATGNYVGLTVERWLSLGDQAVRIFTRRGPAMAGFLRENQFGVTEFDGRGRDGPVHHLFIQARRRGIARLVNLARQIDPECFYVVEDVRSASTAYANGSSREPTGWRAIIKKK
jgi:uncharacterized protein YebE (UPF0316 family)